jgi:hypothetical protein
MKKLHESLVPRCDSIGSANSAVKTWAEGGDNPPKWPLGGEVSRTNLQPHRPAGTLPPAFFFSDPRAPHPISLAWDSVWRFAAYSGSARPKASEPKGDGAQDDFSIPADPPEVGMKR